MKAGHILSQVLTVYLGPSHYFNAWMSNILTCSVYKLLEESELQKYMNIFYQLTTDLV